MINIIEKDGKIYFVLNNDDSHLFENLDGVKFAHPELTGYIETNRFRLERRYMQMEELSAMSG